MKAFTSSNRALLLALAIVLAPPAHAQQACQAVADGIRSGKSAIAPSPARQLTPQQAMDTMQGEFHASPRLQQAMKDHTAFSGGTALYQPGASNLHAAVTTSGSAGCQSFLFFATASDGTSDIIETPQVLQNLPEGSMFPCSGAGSDGKIGMAGGEPAFITTKYSDLLREIGITPWRDAAWQKACSVDVSYDAVFTVAEKSCSGVDCTWASDLARTLAIKHDWDSHSLPPQKTSRPEFSTPSELPTFGQSKDIQIDFAPESMEIPVTFDGTSYIARLGHASIGWRYFPDYLVALYRPVGDRFEPVAGIHITKTLGKPVNITVK